tara:strand:- start:378 stop:503 length:126 start_codon:yes stop_codon:yes gene_type:complete
VVVVKNIKSVVCNEKSDIKENNKSWKKILYGRKVLGSVPLG